MVINMKQNLNKMTEPLLKWFDNNKRNLPWRETNDPYKIWISEIMLQQTRVEAVKEYYLRFIKEIPTIQDLANIEEDKLLKLWEGLGYYSRARNLHKCAKQLIANHQYELPRDYVELKALPGIGPYAAASIGSIAYNLKTPAIDGNVLRVMTRILEDDRDILNQKVRKDYFEKLKQIMPNDTRNFTEGLMELGALICLPNGEPKCDICPMNFLCQSYKNQTMMEYPKKKKEINRKMEEKTILILEYNNKIAIQKRPEKGLLASLYEFYSLNEPHSVESLKKELEKLEITYEKIIPLGKSKHIFSHIEWKMTGFYILCKKEIKKNFIWVTKEELQNHYSVPKAYSYYAKQIKM